MNAKAAPGVGPRRPVAEVDAKPAASGTPLAGGHLLSAISTSIVGILREHYGRGPMKAKTYALDDIIVVVMRGSGFTALEQTIMDSGEPERVIAMREDFQRVMAERLHAIACRALGSATFAPAPYALRPTARPVS